ncbi:hypothetical protein OFN33_28280, partial [Escherichia coli]|nr:hypothetical protein [Escherichia coli]
VSSAASKPVPAVCFWKAALDDNRQVTLQSIWSKSRKTKVRQIYNEGHPAQSIEDYRRVHRKAAVENFQFRPVSEKCIAC